MNEQSKDMTMDEKKEFNAKKKKAADAYAARKVSARSIITKFLERDESLPANVKEAILYISGTGVRSERAGIVSELKALIMEKKSVSSVDIFNKFEYGRPTMNAKIKGFINAKPEDRIWVIFEAGNYVLKGKGENAPKGWSGVLPTVKKEL